MLLDIFNKLIENDFVQQFIQVRGGTINIILWVITLKQNKIFQSMSRKATCADNAVMENSLAKCITEKN
ncbi:hypothetical protein BFZC1_17029 [Lysinibacillus fusiformis ZC1]|nr:hypothetical protein BFZC1_17029 [Lysinibacillus fusiformis ZC1]